MVYFFDVDLFNENILFSDVINNLPSNKDKPAVVNSILVSLGLLKYRNEAVLSSLIEWISSHRDVCRPSDIASAVITLATVDYLPVQADYLLEVCILLLFLFKYIYLYVKK